MFRGEGRRPAVREHEPRELRRKHHDRVGTREVHRNNPRVSRPSPMMRAIHALASRYPRWTRRLLTVATTFGTRRLIVYLTPGHELRSGGVLAIASYYRESIALRQIHRARVALCTVPG